MTKFIFFFISFSFIFNISVAQITLQYTYNDAGYCAASTNGFGGQKTVYIVHLEVSGDKYVKIDRAAQIIDFYNIDYSFWKSINFSAIPPLNVGTDPEIDKSQASILYISEHLFDTDPEIEFMYTYALNYNSTWHATTQIINEDATLLFSRTAAPLITPTFHNQFYPIYNTTNGTMMILSNINGTAEIFSLGGTFTAGIATNNILSNAAQMSLFPNPTMGTNMITVNYQLPQETKTANLIIHDAQGNLLKSYKIGNAMNSILFDASEFSSGTYTYSIVVDGRIIDSKKMVKQ